MASNYGLEVSAGKLVYTAPDGSQAAAPGTGMIAPEYSATTNYTKGDLVFYSGKLYSAKQNITAETWHASKWQETTIAAAIAAKADKT